MMKKLVVLILVFGMASAASAGLSLVGLPAEINVGDTVTVGVSSDDNLQYDAFLLMENNGLAAYGDTRILGITVPAAALNYFGTAVDPTVDAYQIVNSDPGFTSPVEPGLGFEFDIMGLGEGTVGFTLMNASFEPVGSGTLTIVPEPISMVLLGLGGLFLRRRK